MAVRRHIVRTRAYPLRNKKKSFRLFLDPALLAEIETVTRFTPAKMEEMVTGPIGHNEPPKKKVIVLLKKVRKTSVSASAPAPQAKSKLPVVAKKRKKKAKRARSSQQVVEPLAPPARYFMIPRPTPPVSVTTTFFLDSDYVRAREAMVHRLSSY